MHLSMVVGIQQLKQCVDNFETASFGLTYKAHSPTDRGCPLSVDATNFASWAVLVYIIVEYNISIEYKIPIFIRMPK